jgi:hypothetical protein
MSRIVIHVAVAVVVVVDVVVGGRGGGGVDVTTVRRSNNCHRVSQQQDKRGPDSKQLRHIRCSCVYGTKGQKLVSKTKHEQDNVYTYVYYIRWGDSSRCWITDSVPTPTLFDVGSFAYKAF